jgi:hypothetical protein
MKKQPNWWVGLRCHRCGRPVRASDPKGGASLHKPVLGPAWAEHHDCTEAKS